MKKICVLLAVLMLMTVLSGCEGQQQAATDGGERIGVIGGPDRADQEYVWISQYSYLSLFVERVHPALEQFAADYGVNVRIAGPTAIDLAAFVATVEQEAARKPAGIIVVGGWDPALSEPVSNAVASGVPVVITDGDMPLSNRLCYVGTDWFILGEKMAHAQIREHQARGLDSGKIAIIMPLVMENMQLARDGIEGIFEGTGYEIVAVEENDSSPEVAAQKTAALLASHRDLTGMIGLDSESGPGIVTALDEAGRSGEGGIIVTVNEHGREFLDNVKNGKVQFLLMERYDVMNYLALQLLYNWHNNVIATGDMDPWQNNWMPWSIDSGLLEVTSENVDEVISWLLEVEARNAD